MGVGVSVGIGVNVVSMVTSVGRSVCLRIGSVVCVGLGAFTVFADETGVKTRASSRVDGTKTA